MNSGGGSAAAALTADIDLYGAKYTAKSQAAADKRRQTRWWEPSAPRPRPHTQTLTARGHTVDYMRAKADARACSAAPKTDRAKLGVNEHSTVAGKLAVWRRILGWAQT